MLQQVQEHSGPEEEEVPSLGEAPACSQAHSACVHPSPADLQAPSAGHYSPASASASSASSSLSRRSFSEQPAARPYHRWQHPLLVLLSVCPVTIRRRSLHCSPPWLQTELLACLFVCLFPCSFVCLFVWWLVCLLACLLAWVLWNGLLHTNLQNPFVVILKPSFGSPMERCVINKETRQPSIHKKNKPTSKRTFYFKACRLKLRAWIHVTSGRSAQASTSPPNKITATSRPQSTTTTTTTGTHSAS